METWSLILLYGVIFFLLTLGIYFLLQSITLVTSAKRNIGKLYSRLHTKDELRVSQLEMERRMFGTTSGKVHGKENVLSRMLQRIDDVLIWSGFGIKYVWLNTSTYVVLSLIIGAVVLLVGLFLSGSIILGVVITCVVVAIPYVYMVSVCDKNYINTENQLIFFINSVSSSSVVTSDIISVMKLAAGQASDPIRSAVNRAVVSSELAENKKNKIEVFVTKLTREVEHPLFVRFIRHLEMSSKNDADYRSISKDFAKQAEDMIDALEERRAIFKNGRNMIMLLFVMGIVVMVNMCGVVEMSFVEVIREMLSTPLRIVLFLAECLIYGGTAIYLLLGSRR